MYRRASENSQKALSGGWQRQSIGTRAHNNKGKIYEEKQFTTKKDIQARKRAAAREAVKAKKRSK